MYIKPAQRLPLICVLALTLGSACGKNEEKPASEKNTQGSSAKTETPDNNSKETPTKTSEGAGVPAGDKGTEVAPEAGASNAAKPVEKKSPEEQVKDTLMQWCQSQKRGGYSAYRAFYAVEFSGVRRIAKKKPKTFDRKGWLADRVHGFDSPVKVDCLNPTITLSSDNKRAEITFEQYWRSNTYADQGDKKIIMAEQGGKWLLIYEDMLTAKKWDRLNFRDGSPATAGPAAVKVGRLRLRKSLPLIAGKKKPMKDYTHDYCYASRPMKLRGFQMKVKPPADAEVAAYRFRIRGSTDVYEDDEGYYACNKRRLKELGRDEVTADGNILELEFDEPTKNWPCYYKVEVKAVDSEGVPLAKGRLTGDFSCPE